MFKVNESTAYEIEDTVRAYPWQPGKLYYSIEDIQKYIEPDIEHNFTFAMWLLGKEPKSPQEKINRQYLMNLVNQYIIPDQEES